MDSDSSKEPKEKKRYELSFLVVSEEASREVLRLAGQHGIEITAESQLKKINLAYKIRQCTQAYFGFLALFSSPEDIKALERDLKTTSSILRSMVISLPAKREVEAGAAAVRETYKPPTRRPARMPVKRAQALSNEALEKKIEEILQ